MSAEADSVGATLSLFHRPGDVFEIRILGAARQGTVSGYFDDPRVTAQAVKPYDGAAEGIYITPNPVDSALLARATNRLVAHAKYATRDDEVVERRRFLVDADPVRPSGISSTAGQLAAACTRIGSVRALLEEVLGWPVPIVSGSGNGAHANYPLSLRISRGSVRQAIRLEQIQVVRLGRRVLIPIIPLLELLRFDAALGAIGESHTQEVVR